LEELESCTRVGYYSKDIVPEQQQVPRTCKAQFGVFLIRIGSTWNYQGHASQSIVKKASKDQNLGIFQKSARKKPSKDTLKA